jgi:hypothetical protein
MRSRFASLIGLVAAVCLSIGCGGGTTKQGGERQDCYPNGTCNPGLVCLSNLCVNGGGTGAPDGGVCQTAANHGHLGNLTMPAAIGGAETIEWILPLESGSPRDELDIQLYSGLGVFPTGITPGTYTLAGADLDYSTCGLCVLIYENIDAQTNYRGVYMATGGTVTLTSVDGHFAGSADHLTFEHVNIDENTLVSTPDPDDCRSAVDGVSFDVPLDPG